MRGRRDVNEHRVRKSRRSCYWRAAWKPAALPASPDKTKKQIAKDGGVDVVLDSLRNAGNTASLILKATSAIRAISSFGAAYGVRRSGVCAWRSADTPLAGPMH